MHVLRMLIDTVLRAARILHSAPGYSMPLSRLHAQLVRELGPGAGSYGEIYQQLKKRTDSFIIVDSARLLTGTDGWPGGVREAYDSALSHAGLGSCVRVTLTEPPIDGGAGDLLAAVGATLAELAATAPRDHALNGYVELGAQQLAEMNRLLFSGGTDHPTTPPRDPQPSA
jgi:hypothetical protein